MSKPTYDLIQEGIGYLSKDKQTDALELDTRSKLFINDLCELDRRLQTSYLDSEYETALQIFNTDQLIQLKKEIQSYSEKIQTGTTTDYTKLLVYLAKVPAPTFKYLLKSYYKTLQDSLHDVKNAALSEVPSRIKIIDKIISERQTANSKTTANTLQARLNTFKPKAPSLEDLEARLAGLKKKGGKRKSRKANKKRKSKSTRKA